MNMQTILEQIEGLELKILQLVNRCEELKAENNTLKKINSELKESVSVKDAEILQTSDKAGNVTVSKELDKQVNTKIREELDHYIEELAMCIQMIEKG